jgi:hypothetical protein
MVGPLEYTINRPEHRVFLEAAKDTANTLYSLLTDYTTPPKFVVVTHKADADGLASQSVLTQTLQIASEFMGNVEAEVVSTRVMDVSPDSVDENSLPSLKREFGDAFYIFADLGTAQPTQVQKVFGGGIVIDHHPAQEIADGVTYLNPCLYGIEGQSELSGAVSSAFVMHALLDIIREEHGGSEQFTALEDKFKHLTLIGLAGGNADQQGNNGLNDVLYQYLMSNRILKKVDSPFFGYYTKTLDKVLAESPIPINLMYRVASKKEVKALFDGQLPPIAHRLCFATDSDGNTGLNVQYMAAHGIDPALYPGVPIVYDDFTSDLKGHGDRVAKAGQLLGALGVTKDTKMCDLPSGSKAKNRLMDAIRDNVHAFAEPELMPRFDSLLAESQYCMQQRDSRLMRSMSLSELANVMTALSKLGEGDNFCRAVDIEVNGRYSAESVAHETLFEEIASTHTRYKRAVYSGMMAIEALMPTTLEVISDGIYHLPLDKLCGGEIPIQVMTGVYGGLVAGTRGLPGHHGILLTSYPIGEKRRKISGRVNLFPGQTVHLGDFFRQQAELGIAESGGGHSTAAACKIRTSKFGELVASATSYDFSKR